MTLSTEDKLDILELCARYNHAFDGENPDAFAATFTHDGAFGSIVGREELKTFVPQKWEQMRDNGTRVCRHWNTSHVIDGDGGTARHRCYALVLGRKGDGPPFIGLTGVYDDVLKKVNGEWKFVRRTFIPDG